MPLGLLLLSSHSLAFVIMVIAAVTHGVQDVKALKDVNIGYSLPTTAAICVIVLDHVALDLVTFGMDYDRRYD